MTTRGRTTHQTSGLLVRALLAVLFTYFVVGGTTTNAMLNLRYKLVTGLLVTVGVIGWLYIRARRRWKWHRTPLDLVLLLWLAAFAISLLANLDAWRRVGIGLWYVGCYIGAWYILQDALANGGLRREILAESFLISGLAVLVFGYVGWLGGIVDWLALPAATRAPLFSLVRATSTLDNPNMLATFLTMLTPFAAGYALRASRRPVALLFGVYAALSALLAFLTFSRAGWIGLGAMAVAFLALLIAHYRLLEEERLAAWWGALSRASKRLILLGVLAALLGGVIGVLFVIRVSDIPGRQTDLRTYLYEAGWQMFREKPLTGYGLFTFGRHVLRLSSVPPLISHAHAHNIPLNIAAELGIPGLLAGLATILVMAGAFARNWAALAGRDRLLLVSGGAALAGFAGQGAFDNTATMATIALTALLVLLIVSIPNTPMRVNPGRARWQTLAIVGLGATLLVTGIWSNAAYSAYVDALFAGFAPDQEYRAAAQRMQSAIDLDPNIPVYSMYKGLFLSWAVDSGDSSASAEAIAAYRRVTELDPYYAPGWANLAALQWAAGERDAALVAMRRAAELAPGDYVMALNLGLLEEQAGNIEAAQMAYVRALVIYPGAVLYPIWRQTELRQAMRNAPEIVERMLPHEQAALLLDQDAREDAVLHWVGADQSRVNRDHQLLIATILEAAGGSAEAAQSSAEALAAAVPDPEENVRVHLARAYLAWYGGNQQAARQELETINRLVERIAINDYIDYDVGPFTYSGYLRLSSPPYLVTGVYAPRIDGVTALLIDRLARLTGSVQ